MGFVGTRLKLGVELDAHMEAVLIVLDCLHDHIVGGGSTDGQSSFSQGLAILIVELKSVAMTLLDQILAIGLLEHRAVLNLAGVSAQTHGAALADNMHLLFHQIDDIVLAVLVELAGVGIDDTSYISRILND